ncbi:MAG: hypothetical protein SGI87_04605 [Flavobacteriales bacterium]|nr:hypothetical protein [Flavobacteriales bacterium]
MTRTIIFISIFLLSTLLSDAQSLNEASLSSFSPSYQDTVWILTGNKPLDDHFKKWKLDLVLDARTTLVGSSAARLGGIRVGMEYRRVHRFGFGAYTMGDGVEVSSLEDYDSRVTSGNVSLSYFSLFYERVLFFHPKWEVSAAMHLADGKVKGNVVLSNNPENTQSWEQSVKPLELSASGYYNLTYWLSAGGGLGYRFMRSTPVEVRDIYDGPVVIAKVKIKFMKLLRSSWDKEVRYEY